MKVHKNESFPADLCLLRTSTEEGYCYIDTKNLDGETNLKYRVASKLLHEAKESDIEELVVSCEPPNEHMTMFSGAFQFADKNEEHPLELDHILFRGSSLRNTEWIVGMALYTGHDTKAMLNSREAPVKVPNMQIILNRCLYGLFFALFAMVVTCSIASMIWEGDNEAVSQ